MMLITSAGTVHSADCEVALSDASVPPIAKTGPTDRELHGQVLLEPGVLPDLVHGDALLGGRHKDTPDEILALRRDGEAGGQRVGDLHDALQACTSRCKHTHGLTNASAAWHC